MLPASGRGRQMGEEREAPARIFTATGRAELWAAGAAMPATGAASPVASASSAGAGSNYHGDVLSQPPPVMRDDVGVVDDDVLELDEDMRAASADAPRESPEDETFEPAAPGTDEVGAAFRRWDR